MHKIDREKLAEALKGPKQGLNLKCIIQAAENLLAISDPGFEVPEKMWGGLARKIMLGRDLNCNNSEDMRRHLEMSGYEIPEWLDEELATGKHLAKGDICVMVFKAMIAKAGE